MAGRERARSGHGAGEERFRAFLEKKLRRQKCRWGNVLGARGAQGVAPARSTSVRSGAMGRGMAFAICDLRLGAERGGRSFLDRGAL